MWLFSGMLEKRLVEMEGGLEQVAVGVGDRLVCDGWFSLALFGLPLLL